MDEVVTTVVLTVVLLLSSRVAAVVFSGTTIAGVARWRICPGRPELYSLGPFSDAVTN